MAIFFNNRVIGYRQPTLINSILALAIVDGKKSDISS
jgi:hypothetical protein